MRPLRVAFISDYFPPHVGGMETWTYQVARAVARRGHSVVVYTPKMSGRVVDEVLDGVEVHRYGPALFSSTVGARGPSPYPIVARIMGLAIWLPIRLIVERGFDAAIVTYVSLGFMGPLLRVLRIPAWSIMHGFYDTSEAVEIHGTVRGLLRATIQNIAIRMPVQGYIVVGNQVAAALLRRRVRGSKLKVIRGGVDLEEVDSVEDGKCTEPQICFVSRFIPERRIDELLRAFAMVVESVPQARLIIVGDGPERGRFEQLARSLSIDGKVSFVGSMFGKAKIEVLKASHILAHPSIKEGMSLTIYESLACCTPVVAYDIPSVKEQLDLTGGGVLVKSHDIEGFANTILNMISDESLRNTLSTRGRRAVEKLRWEEVAANVIQTIS